MAYSPLQRTIAEYIISRAPNYKVNPYTALGTAWNEGLYLKNPLGFTGDQGRAFGPYQLFTGGGLGNEFQRRYGPLSPSNWQKQVDFALETMGKGGYQHWNAIGDTARKAGYSGAGSGKGNNILGPITSVGQRTAAALGLTPGSGGSSTTPGIQMSTQSPNGQPNQGDLPAEGAIETAGTFPNDFLSKLGIGGKTSNDGYEESGFDLGSNLMAAGAALMARDNPEGAAALSRSLGSRRTKSPKLRPTITQAPSGKGFVSVDPTTGQPKFIPYPPEAQEQPKPIDPLVQQQQEAEIERTRAQTKAYEAQANKNDAKANAPEKPQYLKPSEVAKIGEIENTVKTSRDIAESSNRLSLAIANGEINPNLLKVYKGRFELASGIAPSEVRKYSELVALLNEGILEKSKTLKGSISDKDLAFLTETVIQGGKEGKFDAGTLYNSLRKVHSIANNAFGTGLGQLQYFNERAPGTVGGTPESGTKALEEYQGYQQGWKDFLEKTLTPAEQAFFAKRDQGQTTQQSGVNSALPPNARPLQSEQQDQPPVQGARKAPDGNWYVPDPNRPGKYLRVK